MLTFAMLIRWCGILLRMISVIMFNCILDGFKH